MKTIKDILQEAVNTYNKWACENSKLNITHAKLYKSLDVMNNLRGIFYNKLLIEIRNVQFTGQFTISNTRLPELIKVTDFDCTFIEGGFLVKLSQNLSQTYGERKELMDDLKAAMSLVEFTIYKDSSFYEIAQITKNIEKYKI